MLKNIRKKKSAKFKFRESTNKQIVCGACKHIRMETDTNPEWQCPGCGKAYSKTERTAEIVKQKRRESHRQQQQKEREEDRGQQVLNNVWIGLGTGAMTLFSGFARTVNSCARPLLQTFLPADPVKQIIGIVIVAATLIYAAYKYFN